ncbi:MAG: hypothetical protein AMXMBFR23_22100 [Chloroflexota bacterium]
MAARLEERHELARLEALRRLQMLDTPREERFERIVRLAKWGFHVPTALVTLVDQQRQWFKARDDYPVSETSREIAFCDHTIRREEPLIVPDARLDPRFANNPDVTKPDGIRFYAGVPVHGPGGHRVGTLCLVDYRPRTLTQTDVEALKHLAALVEREMNASAAVETASEGKEAVARLKSLSDSLLDGLLTIDRNFTILTANRAAERILGVGVMELRHADLRQFLTPEAVPVLEEMVAMPGVRGSERELAARSRGHVIPVEVGVAPIQGSGGTEFVVQIDDLSGERREERTNAVLVEVGRLLLEVRDDREVADAIAHGLGAHAGDWAYVALASGTAVTSTLSARNAQAPAAEVIAQALHLGVAGGTLVLPPALQSPTFGPGEEHGLPGRQVGTMPILVEQRPAGLILLGSTGATPLTAECLGLLQSVARLAAFVMHSHEGRLAAPGT